MHPSAPHNEKELLIRASAGDENAFAHLFYAYHNKLGAFIQRLTGSPVITEEIVQDIFVKIWIKRESLASVERFGPYIYVLSRNHTINCLRQIAREDLRSREVIRNFQILQTPGLQPDLTSGYYQLLDEAVEELPPQQQRAYILSKRERLKYEEIAQQMQISHETVKKYLKLAIRSVTRYIRTHGDLLVLLLLITLAGDLFP